MNKIQQQISIFLILTILLSQCGFKKDKKSSEVNLPNVVWIVLEDQSAEFFPMYGNEIVKLPEIEKLADQSFIYENAYSPAPVCSPARSSIITGMYPTTLGTHNMRCYNAYDTANQPGIGIPSYSPVVPVEVQPFTHYLRKAGYYCTNNAKEDYNFATLPSMWDESSKKATWRNREKPDQPFFSVFNIEVTHESRIWQNGNEELYVNPDDVKVPPYFPDDSIVRHDMAVNYSNLVRADQQVGEIIEQLKEDSLYDNTIIFFYADHGGPFPRHKRALYETGTKVPMMVKIGAQSNTARIEDMVSFIDLAPTMLSLVGIEPPEYIQGSPFLGDFVPEDKIKYIFTASDRFDECYDRVRAVRSDRFKYIRNFDVQKPYAIPVSYRLNMPMMLDLIRQRDENTLDSLQAKWLAASKPPEELYDLKNDPYELNNLADDPDYKKEKEKLQLVLNEWISSTGDLGSQNEKELIRNWRVDGHQPKLPTPQLEMKDKSLISIANNHNGITNLWKYASDEKWNMYTKPITITENMSVEFKSVKIGFEESAVVSFEN